MAYVIRHPKCHIRPTLVYTLHSFSTGYYTIQATKQNIHFSQLKVSLTHPAGICFDGVVSFDIK